MTPRPGTGFQTEIEFTLPKGFLDETGILHRHGLMRLATAADEILPLRDPRVQQNPAYLAIVVLARVVMKLGSLAEIDTRVIEGLYASDLDHLQRLYEQFNSAEETDPRVPGQQPAALTNGHLGGNGGFGVMGEA
jgi:hypothetical protein